MSDNDDVLNSKESISKDESEGVKTPSRRRFLTVGLFGTATGLLGYGAGFKHVENEPPNVGRFKARGKAIFRRHNQQTQEIVANLKAKYENAVLGKMRVWDLIEKLAFCVDVTDPSLLCTSQFIHVQQTLAAMENDRITDRDLLLAALLHDVGKVVLLAHELPENILCQAARMSTPAKGAGLDQVVFQFGHPEIIYSRLKDHVPDHLAWLVRYHNISISDCSQFMNAKDQEYTKKYLTKFQKYDKQFKSFSELPRINLEKYRTLIEDTFPNPILF